MILHVLHMIISSFLCHNMTSGGSFSRILDILYLIRSSFFHGTMSNEGFTEEEKFKLSFSFCLLCFIFI